MSMFESHMLKNANNISISNSSLNIGPSAEQLAYEKLAAAAAHTALHDAPARTDETRCHKNTRVNVIDNLEHWAQGIFEEEASLFWLYGGAGAGKSAIMQTLSERCAAQGLALGSFFFSRNDSTRNNAMVLLPTLAYQVATLVPDALQVLHPAINRDAFIFKKSLQVQLIDLLVRPLQHLVELGAINGTTKSPRVFLIDGLDECNNPDQQQEIIRAVATVCHEHRIPVKFIIASRPELPISASFRSYKQANHPLGSISLSEDPSAQADIWRFIKDEFAKICLHHPFNENIPPEWPNGNDVNRLVQKSSSHFIYASTAMKYIWSAKENPARSLQVVLGLSISRTVSPFAELDALYHHIFLSAGHLDKILQILAHCLFSSLPSYASIICIMHEYSLSDFNIFVADMAALITTSHAKFDPSEKEVKLLHASLEDFLCDPERSGSLYLDEHLYLASKLGRCIQLLHIYSLNLSTEPKWPLTRIAAEPYIGLYSQMQKTICLSGNIDAVQGVLGRTSLHHLYHCTQLLSEIEGFKHLYSGWIPKILLEICKPETLTSVSKRYMEEFLDIVELAMKSESSPLGSIILPLIFLGFPTPDLNTIFAYHFQGTPGDTLLRAAHSNLDGSPTIFERVVECIAISDYSICHRRVNLSPGQLAAAVEAILDYRAPWPPNEIKLNIALCLLCQILRRPGPLFNAVLWLLPKAGFSKKIVIFSQKEDPYRCINGPCSGVQKCLDTYCIRFQNEPLTLRKSPSGSVPSTPLLRVIELPDDCISTPELDIGTRQMGLDLQQRGHVATGTGPLGSESGYDRGPLGLGSSLSAYEHGTSGPLAYSLNNMQIVSRRPRPDVARVDWRPTRVFRHADLLDREREPGSASGTSGDGKGHQKRLDRPTFTLYNTSHERDIPEFHMPTALPIDSEPSGYLARKAEREQAEVREMKEDHITEIKALLHALSDSQKTINKLRKENGQLMEENGKLREMNDQLRDGLASEKCAQNYIP